MDHFRTLLVENACEKSEEKLMNAWFPLVTGLFSGDQALVVGGQGSKFYECVSTLVANQVSMVLVCCFPGLIESVVLTGLLVIQRFYYG